MERFPVRKTILWILSVTIIYGETSTNHQGLNNGLIIDVIKL